MPQRFDKTLTIVAAKAAGGAPSTEQLAAINAHALVELQAEDVYARTMYLAHNAIDRDREAFDDGILDDFARTLPGKGLHVRHPNGWDGDSGPGEGKFFSARTVTMTLDEARAALRTPELQFPPGTETAKLLEASFYLARIDGDVENARLMRKIDAGIASYVSLGFRAAKRDPITDGTGSVIAERLVGPGEAFEGSLVWLGAQPGAHITKGARRGAGNDDEENDMTEEQIKALQQAKAAADEQLKTLQPKSALHDALCKALGVEQLDTAGITSLVQQAADGKAYRASLVDDVVACRRQKGLLGDTEAEVAEAKTFYSGMPLKMLQAEAEAARKELKPGEGQIDGGDPNATGADPDGDKGLRDASVTHKALVRDQGAAAA
jgi:hypothetical protein